MRTLLMRFAVCAALSLFSSLALGADDDGHERRCIPDRDNLPGWTAVTFQDYERPVGKPCDFALHVHILKQKVIQKVTKTFPDGKPQQLVAIGPMLVEYSNPENGKHVVRSLGGDAVFDYSADGSFQETLIGPNEAGRLDGYPKGWYWMDGYHVNYVPLNGLPQPLVASGIEENICETLR
jgi:hypothetical protein